MAEYARFGEGWVTRADSEAPWTACDPQEIPAERIAEETMTAERRKVGYDPFYENPGPQILPNPEGEALAEELGLSISELRGRLNGDAGGTRNLVSEERFDEIAAALGLTPEEARKRFKT